MLPSASSALRAKLQSFLIIHLILILFFSKKFRKSRHFIDFFRLFPSENGIFKRI